MIDSKIVLRHIVHEVTRLGAQVLRMDTPTEFGATLNDVVFDNWFYNSFLVRAGELRHPDLDLIYTQPAAQCIARGVARSIRSRVLAALSQPKDVSDYLGTVAGNYAQGYSEDIKLNGGPVEVEIDHIVSIGGEMYGVIERTSQGDGTHDVLLDRPLVKAIDEGAAVCGGLLNAQPHINFGGVTVMAPPLSTELKDFGDNAVFNNTEHGDLWCRTTEADAEGGRLINVDVLIGIAVDPSRCHIKNPAPALV